MHEIAPDVLAFRPQFPLWSDGAEKHRWISLPPGGVIDTHDMDHWSLPQGTRIWKEFAREGHRIETRVLAKIGPTDSDWAMQSYIWNADETEATAAPRARRADRTTTHHGRREEERRALLPTLRLHVNEAAARRSSGVRESLVHDDPGARVVFGGLDPVPSFGKRGAGPHEDAASIVRDDVHAAVTLLATEHRVPERAV